MLKYDTLNNTLLTLSKKHNFYEVFISYYCGTVFWYLPLYFISKLLLTFVGFLSLNNKSLSFLKLYVMSDFITSGERERVKLQVK